jgi:uncharacterized protein YndB with AHSA1/START domain
MIDKFSAAVTINSDTTQVWNTLTNPELMREWMGDPEMKIEVLTDWTVNSPILINVFHHIQFVSRGTILQYDKEKKLSYSHLGSISRLADLPENYSIIEFILLPVDGQTHLTINIENFPTETIRKHLEFYWRTTIFTIKTAVEKQIG